jgi:flagellin FlaB
MSRRRLKAIVGIESAIVLIAFVIVAAALAFVVLNMGFFASQRSKAAIGTGLAQASSALEIDGTVLALVNVTSGGSTINCIAVPVKLSAAQQQVDLSPNRTAVSVWTFGKISYPNVYDEADTSTFATVNLTANLTTICESIDVSSTQPVHAKIVWITPNDGDFVLSAAEKALVVVRYDNSVAPAAYDMIKIEVKPPIGGALTVERQIPASLTQQVIDLG